MKKFLIALTLLSTVCVSQAASADGRRHYRSNFDNHYFSRYNNHYRGYRANPYHYGRGRRGSSFGFSYGTYGYGFGYSNRHYGRRYRDRFDGGEFVGGLVLGSILNSAARSNNNYVERYSRPRYVSSAPREVVYTSAPRTIVRSTNKPRTPVLSGRRLIKDLEGNCFERVIDDEGTEIREQLDPAECEY